MKKLTTLWMMVVMLAVSLPASAMMSKSKVRENARFLTDRMAYELHLSPMQYDDVYEVNYDFIDNVRYFMDDVVRGYGYAVDRYYECLDYRNDDLRWILSASQYRRFMGVDYFYRPIYTTPNRWLFRIYRVYTDIHHFHFGKPHHYKTYKGGHYRIHHGHVSFYKHHRKNHYKHDFYKGDIRAHRNKPDARPKGNARPAPERKKEVKAAPERKPAVRQTPPRNERKEVKKNTKVEAKPTAKKREVKNGNSRRSEMPSSSSRTSSKEKQEGRRAVRNR